MTTTITRVTLFGLYQLTVALGIALLPLALAAKRVGVTLPIHRVIATVGDAYDEAAR